MDDPSGESQWPYCRWEFERARGSWTQEVEVLNAGAESAEIEETNIQGGARPSANFARDRCSGHAASFTKLGHTLDPGLEPLSR
jgi:hypothetical protein